MQSDLSTSFHLLNVHSGLTYPQGFAFASPARMTAALCTT